MLIETQLPGIVNHADMNGLANDDHTQYLLADGTRAATELYIGSGYLHRFYDESGDVRLYSDGDIYLDTTDKVHISGDLDVLGTEIHLSYGGLRIISNDVNYDAEYNNYDSSNHYFQYQGNNLFAVKSDGIYIYSSTDYGYLSMAGSDLEIWGGTGDITMYPYDLSVIHFLYAYDGIQFDSAGSMTIRDSTGDMYFESPYGFTFDGQYALQSLSGFRSSAGNDGVTESVDFSGGTMYFEDGLLVYVAIF